MSFSCLGSIFSKGCECGSFNLCNSNRNIVLVGTANERVNAMITENQGLMSIVGQIGEKADRIQLTPTRSIRKLTGRDDSITRITAIRAAIVQISLRLSSNLMRADDRFNEGWQKFLLAQAACDMNLDNMYHESEPLTSADVTQLEKGVLKVARYSLTAVILWKMGCKNGFNANKLRINEGLAEKQVNFIKKHLKTKTNFADAASFWDLEIDVQKIFLEGAEFFPKQFRQICQMQDAYCFNLETLPKKNKEDDLLNQVVKKANSRRPSLVGEHKNEESIERAEAERYMGVSPLSMNRGRRKPDLSPHRASPRQAAILETSNTLMRSSMAASSSGQVYTFRTTDADAEDATLINKNSLEIPATGS